MNAALQDPWLSQKEAAEYLGLSSRHLRLLISQGKVRASRVRGGRAVRIRQSDLDALLRPIPTVGTMGGVAS